MWPTLRWYSRPGEFLCSWNLSWMVRMCLFVFKMFFYLIPCYTPSLGRTQLITIMLHFFLILKLLIHSRLSFQWKKRDEENQGCWYWGRIVILAVLWRSAVTVPLKGKSYSEISTVLFILLGKLFNLHSVRWWHSS